MDLNSAFPREVHASDLEMGLKFTSPHYALLCCKVHLYYLYQAQPWMSIMLPDNLLSIDCPVSLQLKNSSFLKVIMNTQILLFVRIHHNASQSIATITFNHYSKALTKFITIMLNTAFPLAFNQNNFLMLEYSFYEACQMPMFSYRAKKYPNECLVI